MQATYDDMGDIVLAFGMPLYWKKPIWDQVRGGDIIADHQFT